MRKLKGSDVFEAVPGNHFSTKPVKLDGIEGRYHHLPQSGEFVYYDSQIQNRRGSKFMPIQTDGQARTLNARRRLLKKLAAKKAAK